RQKLFPENPKYGLGFLRLRCLQLLCLLITIPHQRVWECYHLSGLRRVPPSCLPKPGCNLAAAVCPDAAEWFGLPGAQPVRQRAIWFPDRVVQWCALHLLTDGVSPPDRKRVKWFFRSAHTAT